MDLSQVCADVVAPMRMTTPASFLSTRAAMARGVGSRRPYRGFAARRHQRVGPGCRLTSADDRTRVDRRERVIVRGTRQEIDAVLATTRRFSGPAAGRWRGRLGRQPRLAALAADQTVDHLSGDALVVPAMAVSNRSVGADQTWAGSPGVVLGLGAIPGVTGAGVGVAVIDSGHLATLGAGEAASSPTSAS